MTVFSGHEPSAPQKYRRGSSFTPNDGEVKVEGPSSSGLTALICVAMKPGLPGPKTGSGGLYDFSSANARPPGMEACNVALSGTFSKCSCRSCRSANQPMRKNLGHLLNRSSFGSDSGMQKRSAALQRPFPFSPCSRLRCTTIRGAIPSLSSILPAQSGPIAANPHSPPLCWSCLWPLPIHRRQRRATCASLRTTWRSRRQSAW